MFVYKSTYTNTMKHTLTHVFQHTDTYMQNTSGRDRVQVIPSQFSCTGHLRECPTVGDVTTVTVGDVTAVTVGVAENRQTHSIFKQLISI